MTLYLILSDGNIREIDEIIQLANDRKWCASNALFTVDEIAFFPAYDIMKNNYVFAVNNARNTNKIIYNLAEDRMIQSSMSDYSYKKFIKILANNRNRILKESEGVIASA